MDARERAGEFAAMCRFDPYGGISACYSKPGAHETASALKKAGADVARELLFTEGRTGYYRIWVRWP